MDGVVESPRFAVEVLQALYFFLPGYLANMAPVIARGHLEVLAAPIDGGRSWRGRRILGDHKTWRGILAGVVTGALVFVVQRWVYQSGFARGLALLDYGSADPVLPGALLGLGAGVGDAVKSFFKRRVDIAPGASWLGFDQLDFFVGAAVFVSLVYVPPRAILLGMLPLVFVCDLAATAVFWRLGWKRNWP
jgi:CDP-2,3-bis-(O-geranylgeranyl)-sn-glycerol synthase